MPAAEKLPSEIGNVLVDRAWSHPREGSDQSHPEAPVTYLAHLDTRVRIHGIRVYPSAPSGSLGRGPLYWSRLRCGGSGRRGGRDEGFGRLMGL